MRRPRALSPLLSLALLVCVCVRPTESVAEDTADYLSQISELNLEDLLTQEVSTVLRKEQPLSGAAAAVYVLTAEDIRRSGAASLPEALRLVPGVTVTRTNAWNWEITVRGFDSDGSAKLLVLIDGRSVYSPLYSGVFWDVQNVVLSDVERVEVIRGPGAVSWGENAVNGVINIITKSAKDTQGGLVQGGGGKEEEGFGTLRYGGKISDDIHYRVYGTGFKRDNFRNIDGSDAKDGWNMAQGGFRIDGQLTEKNSFTAQGDIYDGDASENILRFESFAPPFTNRIKNQINLHGGNALLRFNRNESEESQLSFQTYYDRTERFTDLYSETRDTFDFDFQHHYKVSEHHDIVYGASHRITTADIDNWPSLGFYPQHRTDHLTTAFVQDEIKLVPETFSVIPGVKLGHNSYTGFEYQPALKAVWTPPDRRQTVWASISRAVRIPAAIDTDIQAFGLGSVAPDGTPMVLGLYGNPDFDSEKLLAYELGYRAEPSKQFSFDVALYYQDYDQLLSLEPKDPFLSNDGGIPHIVSPLRIENHMNGRTYGVELYASWRASDFANFSATYTHMQVDVDRDPLSMDPLIRDVPRRNANNQASLRAHFNLPWDLEFDTILYYVDSIPAYAVSSYLRTDARLAWNIKENLALELIGQNLFDPTHREYGTRPTEVDRAYFGRVTYRFE